MVKHFKMLCRLYRMTRSNLESQNWNFQFTLTESSYICILTSEFIANWFFKCLKNTVQLRSLFVTSLCIFSPKALQMLSKTHRSAWIKNNFIFSSVLNFIGHISTSNLSLSTIYLRIQLLHLRQRNKNTLDKKLKHTRKLIHSIQPTNLQWAPVL